MTSWRLSPPKSRTQRWWLERETVRCRRKRSVEKKAQTLSGGLQLDFDPTGMSPEELKEKMMEQLKEQGINVDGADIQIMSSSESPVSAAGDDKD